MFPGALSLICLCSSFPGLLYALPQQSITLAEFGDVETAGAVNVGGPGLATEFLSLKGATGGDQTTFEYVEVDTFGGSTTTFTGELVASASGFVLDATATDATATATLQLECHATAPANAGGSCTEQVDGESTNFGGPGIEVVLPVVGASSGSGSSSSSSQSNSGSPGSSSQPGSPSPSPSGKSNNAGFKHAPLNRKTLAGVGLGGAMIVGSVLGGI